MFSDLLDQAVVLATIDLRRPKQANLRRAVSTTYYSLFHFLVDRSCRAILGGSHKQRGFRDILARAFVHANMLKACSSFDGGQLPKQVEKTIPLQGNPQYVILKPIQNIASAFCELQQKRHLADYDLSERFERSEVLTLIDQVRSLISAFDQLPLTDDRQFFLVSLLAWKEMSGRT